MFPMEKHHWMYLCVGMVALSVFIALGCTIQPMSYRACVKMYSLAVVSAFLQIGALLGAGWLGVEVVRSTRKTWLGWLAAIAAALLFSFALFYAGFPGPSNEY